MRGPVQHADPRAPRRLPPRAARRPDILLTNYKMLDLLLLRAEEAPLWAVATASKWTRWRNPPTSTKLLRPQDGPDDHVGRSGAGRGYP
ncbi:MAG: hypothetical protein ACRDTE_06885 [Pseudonocardiaceae bacterium]